MKQDIYDKVVKFVNDAFEGKNIKHFERTVYWMSKFYPDSTDAHRIAAYSHDIERGIMKERDRDYLNKEFLIQHMNDGARIMGEFLKKEGADNKTIEKIKHLIQGHEIGGDEEQNALMDADSVSYFETNAEMFVTKRVLEDGYEKVKGKLDWMFDRISTDEHKKFAQDNYVKWSKVLEESRDLSKNS